MAVQPILYIIKKVISTKAKCHVNKRKSKNSKHTRFGQKNWS